MLAELQFEGAAVPLAGQDAEGVFAGDARCFCRCNDSRKTDSPTGFSSASFGSDAQHVRTVTKQELHPQVKTVSKVTFSNRLRSLMENRGENASDIARAVGVSHVAVGNLLKGQMPRSELLYAIACHFGVSMDYFFGGNLEPTGIEPDEPLPENPTIDQFREMADRAKAGANALRIGAERFGRLKEVVPRIQSLEREAAALRALIEEMVAAGYAPGASPPSPPKPAVSSGLSPEQVRAMVKQGGDRILQNMRSGQKPKPAK